MGKRRKDPVDSEARDEMNARLFPTRVGASLRTLKRRLDTSRATDASESSQSASLDPDGMRWKTFEDTVRGTLREKRADGASPEQKRLYTQLVSANSMDDPNSELLKTLHFAFIDHILNEDASRTSSTASKLADLRYPTEWYTAARALQRDIHLHVGPTNSGKTYNALKRLEEAGNGFYAGPLRLLAHEVYSRFRAKGIPCDLVTGDDVRYDASAEVTLYASTVEMVDCSRLVDVAVIDEIQMMASEDRGWAWTRAFLGANAREVHLCGETRVVPLVRELAASMGDNLHIHEYDRLNPLKAMSRSLRGNLKNLRKGDCVVSFSIIGIHALKKQIELETGKRCAIVYGSLPPETRAQQAALFNDPHNDYDYLVASDAIGMGLNLSIKRIVFESLRRWNGTHREQLSIPAIKQIAGRAGRYRSAHQDTKSQVSENNSAERPANEDRSAATVGLVTCLDEADLPAIQEALKVESPPIKAAGILPPAEFVEEYAARLPHGIPFEYVMQRLCDIANTHPRFMLCNVKDQLRIARVIEPVNSLTPAQRYIICSSPGSFRDAQSRLVIEALAEAVAAHKQVTIADIPEIPLEVLDQPLSGDRLYLEALERLHKALILFLWLSYRFINTFRDREMAFHAKELVEEKINICLLEFSANPNLRKRFLLMKQMASSRHSSASSSNPALSHSRDPDSPAERVRDSTALPLDWSRGSPESAIATHLSLAPSISVQG